MLKHWILSLGILAILLILAWPAESFPVQVDGPKIPDKIARFFQPPAEFANDMGTYKSPLKFDDGSPVKNAADWKKRRQEILKTWHDFLGPWPDLIQKPKIEYLSKEKRENFTQCHVRIEIAPGKMTDDAYLLIPQGKGPFPAVVVVFYEAKTGIGQNKGPHRDFAYQLAKRGFVTLSVGGPPETYYPNKETAKIQPLSFHAYCAANCWHLLASLDFVDAQRIGIVGHSYGGKWALFASCLFERFACAAWSDPGIVFDEKRSNVNYWERWYLGHEIGKERQPGIPSDKNPRTGPYKKMIETGHDLHELHVLMAPRPFLVSGGAEDPPLRWQALNHSVAVNRLLGFENRVAMTNRPMHSPNEESNEQMFLFFEHFLAARK
jgi:Prolyl oligopeptidase family